MSKTVVITGASSGIGHAVSIEFAKRGYNVIAGARRVELMDDLKAHGIRPVKLDVTSPEDVAALKKLIELEYNGEVLYLHNNAGQPCRYPAGEAEDDLVKDCYEVNFFGVVRVTRELLPFVIKTKGTIGFTGSVSAILPLPFFAIYASSKAALRSYANILAMELQPFGVKVCNIMTGGVSTDITSAKQFKPDSIYRVPGFDEYAERTKSIVKGCPVTPEAYAKVVVTDFEKAQIGRVEYYRGYLATVIKLSVAFLPRRWLVNSFIKNWKLTKMFDSIANKAGKMD